MPRRRPIDAPLLAGAVAFAAVEIGAALLLGRFFAWGRAEALLFLAFRPWLLLVAALAVARLDWRRRLACYVAALTVAGLAESLFLAALGGRPWAEMLRGQAAGLALVLAIDLALRLGGTAGGRPGRWVATIAIALLLSLPYGLWPYERLALGATAPRAAAARPPLRLMTGLPIVWGEGGPFDPGSRPAAAYRALQAEFDVQPIDYLDSSGLAGDGLLLLAQPRLLEPSELVALDRWVRGGGRLLVLADPVLRWPSRLAPGDARRPPPASLLSPLLDRWGLRLDARPEAGLVVAPVLDRGERRRLVLDAPGRFTATAGSCAIGRRDYLAACAIGRGRVWLVADADLLRDALWVGASARGAERHARLSDNPLLVASWLDRLAGVERERAARPVRWMPVEANRAAALAAAAIPLLLLGAFATVRRRRRPTHRLIHRSRIQNRRGIGTRTNSE